MKIFVFEFLKLILVTVGCSQKSAKKMNSVLHYLVQQYLTLKSKKDSLHDTYQYTPSVSIKTKELRRIDWRIVKRILNVLYCEGPMRKTHIAIKCNLNYSQTTLYLNWLDMVNFIKKSNDDRFEVITLSNKGADLYVQKLKEIEVSVIERK